MILKKIYKRAVRIFKRNEFGSERWKKQFEHFGKNSMIYPPASISVEGRLSIGDNTTILGNSRIENYSQSEHDSHIYIGSHCWIMHFLTLLNASTVTIGDNVLIASHVLISSENHGVDPESEIPYMDQPLVSKPVSIGDGCWIGENVCILPGVTIGRKCVIGAGTVVTKSIPDYSIAVGNPAKVIKQYNFETHNWERV